MADRIIAVVSLIISIIATFLSCRANKKSEEINRALVWSLEVCAISLKSQIHKEKLLEYFERADSKINEMLFVAPIDDVSNYGYNCVMKEYLSLDNIDKSIFQDYIFIKNNSENSIYIEYFRKEDCKIVSGKFLEPEQTILIGLQSYEKPSILVINYNGTHLCYDLTIISEAGTALRPLELI